MLETAHNPIFLIGNQKSGTTAIARLLSHATGKSLTCDLQSTIRRPTLQLELQYHLIRFEEFLDLYKDDFSSDIIKEPFLSFYLPQVLANFPHSHIVFILRNPYQSIRSILDRLKIPGNLSSLDLFDWPELNKTPVWRLALQSSMYGIPASNYIEAMAHRWNFLVELYKQNMKRCIFIKYEDFCTNKIETVERLALKLKLVPKYNITEFKDKQFQPKGNPNVNLHDFFGAENFNIIDSICEKNIKHFGY